MITATDVRLVVTLGFTLDAQKMEYLRQTSFDDGILILSDLLWLYLNIYVFIFFLQKYAIVKMQCASIHQLFLKRTLTANGEKYAILDLKL